MEWYQVFLAVGTSTVALLSAIKALFGKSIDGWLENRKVSKNKELELKQELASIKMNFGNITSILEEMKDQIKEGHELDLFFIEDRSRLADLIDLNNTQEGVIAAIKEGVVAITRDRLLYLIKKYISDGSISISDFENIQSLYEAYTALGGNHTVTELMNDINKLPKKK